MIHKTELAHLKWRLIKFEGLSPSQADKRIEKIKKFELKTKADKKKRKKAESEKPKKTLKQKLNEDMKRLRKKNYEKYDTTIK